MSEQVVDMYRKLSSSSRYVYNAVQLGNFVGLRKSVLTRVSESNCALICNLLHLEDSVAFKFQSFDRFVLNRTVFSLCLILSNLGETTHLSC